MEKAREKSKDERTAATLDYVFILMNPFITPWSLGLFIGRRHRALVLIITFVDCSLK